MGRYRVSRAAVASYAVALLLSASCAPKPGGDATTPGRKAARTVTSAVEPVVPDALARPLQPPSSGAYLGVFHPPAPYKSEALDAYTHLAGKPPAIVMWYQAWGPNGDSRFDAGACESVYERGAVPLITWEPWNPPKVPATLARPADQPKYSLSNIVSGRYDGYIRSWARAIKDLGGPVMLRPMHEMNGTWYPWGGFVNGNSPELFKAAWRHMHDIFAEEGATNVTWVWSPNRESAPSRPDNSFAAYYPGDAYVDWTAISGFNWGTSTKSTGWMAFSVVGGSALKYLETLDKPIIIAETGCVEQGGDKAAWITDAYTEIRTLHPKLRAVVWYDTRDERPNDTEDWRIDSSQSSLRAFRAAVADDYYSGASPAALSSWSGGLSTGKREALRRLGRVY